MTWELTFEIFFQIRQVLSKIIEFDIYSDWELQNFLELRFLLPLMTFETTMTWELLNLLRES